MAIIQVTAAGIYDAEPGDIFNIDETAGPITGNITFNSQSGGPVAFTVNFQSDLTGPAAGDAFVTFGANTQPVVTVAGGIDISSYRLDANGESFDITIDDGATLNRIDAGGLTGTGTAFTVDAGNSVAVANGIAGPILNSAGDTDIRFGSDADITGSIIGSTSGATTVNIGDRGSIDGVVRATPLGVDGTADFTFGSDVTITGDVSGGTRGDTTIVFGDNAIVGGDLTLSQGSLGPTVVSSLTLGNTANIGGTIWSSGNGGTAIIQGGDSIFVGDGIRTGSTAFSTFVEQTISFGDGLNVTGSVFVNGSGGTASISAGANASVTVDVRTGSGTTATFDSQSVTLGDNAEIGRNIFTSGFGPKTLSLGNNASVGANVNLGQSAGSSIVRIGTDLTVQGGFFGTTGADNITIGDRWFVNNSIDIYGGDDQVALGYQASLTDITTVSGNSGSDGLTVAAPPGQETAFIAAAIAAGWTDNGDATVSAAAGATNFIFGAHTYTLWEGPGNPICFAAGTQIEVADGKTGAVEDLRQGDMVMTADHGLQPVRWIGVTTLTAPADNMRPIRIAAGALGDGLPAADLVVSPQHRMLVRSKIAQRMFGQDEVLVAAKHLLALDGIAVIADCDEVTYVHFLCDRHEVVFANGAASESLFTGPQALKSVSPAAVTEIMALFPELADVDYKALSARPFVNGRKGRQLAERHKANSRPLLANCH